MIGFPTEKSPQSPFKEEPRVRKLAIEDITADPTIQIRRANHEATIQRYEESFEKLPPVTVYDTDEGLLLADGFHRLAAAIRRGEKKIEADVRKGTRADALEYAVIANTQNADPLTPDERDNGIRRLKQLHPDWALRKIAEAMSVSHNTVQRVFKVDEVRQATFTGVSADTPSETHYRAIARAPKEHWQPLVEAAQERGWSSDDTARAVSNLRDESVPEKHKRELVKGKADPLERTPDGELAVPRTVIERRIKETQDNDAMLAFHKALEALASARMFRTEAILSPADGHTLERWAKELPGDIAFLEEVLEGAKGAGKLRAV